MTFPIGELNATWSNAFTCHARPLSTGIPRS